MEASKGDTNKTPRNYQESWRRNQWFAWNFACCKPERAFRITNKSELDHSRDSGHLQDVLPCRVWNYCNLAHLDNYASCREPRVARKNPRGSNPSMQQWIFILWVFSQTKTCKFRFLRLIWLLFCDVLRDFFYRENFKNTLQMLIIIEFRAWKKRS